MHFLIFPLPSPVCVPKDPFALWRNHRVALCEDFQRRTDLGSNNDTSAAVENRALWDVECSLQAQGKSLCDFPPMPVPYNPDVHDGISQLMREETNFDTAALQRQEKANLDMLTADRIFHFCCFLRFYGEWLSVFVRSNTGASGGTAARVRCHCYGFGAPSWLPSAVLHQKRRRMREDLPPERIIDP
jgi:hypothetical protein